MKQIARLVIGFSLGLVLLTGCIPPPFFGPGPERHEGRDRGPDHGDNHGHGESHDHDDHGRDFH